MHKPLHYLLYSLLALAGWSLDVRAESLPSFNTPATGARTIGKAVSVLEDPDGRLTFAQIRSPDLHWQPNPDAVFNRGYSRSVWWLRFQITNPRAEQNWLMEIAYAPLDSVDVLIERADGQSQQFNLGDKRPFAERPLAHRYFLIPLVLAQQESVEVTLRLQTAGSMQAPISLWQVKDFYARDIAVTATQGLYYGGLLIIGIYNLLIYSVLRERYYLYYVGWVGSMFWFMASLNGWAFQFWWPSATTWNDQSILASLSLVVFFGFQFAGTFLGVTSWSIRFKYAQNTCVLICLAFLGAALGLPYHLVGLYIIPFAAFGCAWGLMVGIVAMVRQVASARIYVLAWAMMLIGGIIMALNKVDVLPRNLLTDYAIQLGSLLEVLLLSFALAERINRERLLRHQAQHNALETQRRANEELEQRVLERTQALEEANLKLKELSDTDQLTSLKNRRFLNLYTEKEFARAQRYQHAIAILMIDVDHFKSINDNYGHPAGDDCLQEVAQRIRREMRWPSDTAARYGGEEFCVVLPETSADGARIVAERIRNKIESAPMTTRVGPLSLTVSIGVHVSIPGNQCSAADFIGKADAALYEAKQNGRNRVTVSTEFEPEI